MSLYVLMTQSACRLPILEAARMVIRGGADVLQLREKEIPDREMAALGRALRKMTGGAGVGLIVNDRPDIAALVGADGCHVGQDDLPPRAARKVLQPDQILGVSTHSLEQAQRAVTEGADYIGIGPVYPTTTKGYERGIGCRLVHQVAGAVGVPVVAIGGITAERVPELLAGGRVGRIGIAVCSAVLGADDIEAATAAFRAVLDANRPRFRP